MFTKTTVQFQIKSLEALETPSNSNESFWLVTTIEGQEIIIRRDKDENFFNLASALSSCKTVEELDSLNRVNPFAHYFK